MITEQQLDGRGRTMSFADDILVYRQGYRQEIAHATQSELDRISLWWDGSNALVNPLKASVTWFSLNNHIVNTAERMYGR